MVTKYVSIENIIEEINRVQIPNTYWNIEEIKEWTYKALSFIDTKQASIKASVIIEIIDGKGLIPASVEKIDRVVLDEVNNTKELHYILAGEEINSDNYEINAGYIYVDFEEGKLLLNYYTIPVDGENRPLIPDNAYYIKAVVSYIRFSLGERAYWQGKILERQLQMLETDWLFYLPAAQANQKMTILQSSKRFRKISNRHYL